MGKKYIARSLIFTFIFLILMNLNGLVLKSEAQADPQMEYNLNSDNSYKSGEHTYIDIAYLSSILNLEYKQNNEDISLIGNTNFYEQETGMFVAKIEMLYKFNSKISNVKRYLYWKDGTVYPIEKEYTMNSSIEVKKGKIYMLAEDLANIFHFDVKINNNKLILNNVNITTEDYETEVYEFFMPEFSVGGYYNTKGKFVTDNSNVYIYTNEEDCIKVTPGEKFRMSFKHTSSNVADVLFLNDDNTVIDYVTNTGSGWIQQIDKIITVPEGATKMYVSVYSNQIFSIEKIYTIKGINLKAISDIEYEKNYLAILKDNQKNSHNQNYTFKDLDKMYLTFVVDDTRPSIAEVYKIFEKYDVPLSIAGVIGNVIYPTSKQSDVIESKVKTIRRIVANGGELLSHENNPITHITQYDTDTMFHQFFKSKYKLSKLGFDINGIILSGGQGQIVGENETDMYARTYYDYSDLYGKQSLGLPYYNPRKGLINYRKDANNVIREIDNALKQEKKQWISYYIHDFTEFPKEELEKLLQYIKTLPQEQLEVATYKNIYQKNVISNPVTSIEMISEPNKLEYQENEELDITGLKVRAICEDGSKIEDFNGYGIRYQNGERFSLNDTKVTLYLPGTNKSFDIQVIVKKEENNNENEFIPTDKPNNYVSYNGHLTVDENGQIRNRNNELFRLIGMSGGDTFFKFDTIWHDDSIKVLKDQWGANTIRIFVMPYRNYNGLPHYIGNEEEYYSNIKTLIDKFISFDMYVDIVWAGENLKVDYATEFFKRLSKDYKNSPYLIYEIENEPYTYKNEEIQEYADHIIPIIRKNSPEALIFVPTANNDPSSILKLEEKTRLDKKYKNIMYSYHQYMNGQTLLNMKQKLLPLLEANIPVFVTEWSSTNAGMVEGGTYDEVTANNFVTLLNKYNIGWYYFCFSETPWEYGIMGHNWDKNFAENSLTNSGKYIRNLLKNQSDIKHNYAILGQLGNGDEDGVLKKNGIDINKITKITFEKTTQIPENIVQINGKDKVDVSYVQNGGVIAYFTNYNNGYEMHIVSEDKIYFPYYSYHYFRGFENVEQIEFYNINTSKVNSLSNMFNQCYKLKELDLSLFDFSNVEYMRYTFANMKSLEKIKFAEDINTQKLKAINNLFQNDEKLQDLNLSNWKTDKITEMYLAFYNLNSITSLNLNNWKLSTDALASTIDNVPNLKELYLVNIDFTQESNTKNLDKFIKNYTPELLDIYVTNQKDKEIISQNISAKNVYKQNYDISFSQGEGYIIKGEPLAKLNSEYSFEVEILEGYDVKDMKVICNGIEIQASSNQTYIIKNINEDIQIIVEGIKLKEDDNETTDNEGNDNEVSNNEVSDNKTNNNENTNNANQNEIQNQNNNSIHNNEKDTTIANSKLPQTGRKFNIVICITLILLIIIGIYSFINFKKNVSGTRD